MYEILPHTADVRVRLVAGDARSLFRDGAAALRDVVKPVVLPDSGDTITLTVEAHDLTSLLVDFLNELIWLLEARHLTPKQVSVVELSEAKLVASLEMETAEGWERDVKAVTYHLAEVQLVGGAWTTTLVFDI